MSKKVIYGIFDDEEVLLDSIKEVRSKEIDIKEVYTPFPVHGLDHALGLERTRLSLGNVKNWLMSCCAGATLAGSLLFVLWLFYTVKD